MYAGLKTLTATLTKSNTAPLATTAKQTLSLAALTTTQDLPPFIDPILQPAQTPVLALSSACACTCPTFRQTNPIPRTNAPTRTNFNSPSPSLADINCCIVNFAHNFAYHRHSPSTFVRIAHYLPNLRGLRLRPSCHRHYSPKRFLAAQHIPHLLQQLNLRPRQPLALRSEILALAHNSPAAGHLGRD